MSYTSGFFDAVDLGGGEYDREYSADVFAHYFSLLVKNGVFPDPSTGMQVKASSSPDMHVSVQPGSGWVNGYYITVPENGPEVLTVPTANPSLSRIDSVIMGLNYVEREIQLYIKSGAVSASPSAVSLQRDNDLYEMELAQITVAAGVASISQANITDMRQNTSRCGIVKGTIDQIDTTDLFAQYDDAFQTWFADIQAQLSGDVATNLQNQINNLKDGKADTSVTDSLQNQVNTLKSDKVNVSDKASTAQAQAGTDNTKWMTPALVKTLFNASKASNSDATTASNDTNWMSPLKVKAFYDSKIASSIEAAVPIGTVKFSIDNPNSALYLLCNGASLNRSLYPSLYQKLPSDFTSGWNLLKTLTLSGLSEIVGVRLVNGYTVILGKTSSYIVYAYGTSVESLSWVTTNIPAGTGYDIGWDGSKYVIMVASVGKYYYASALSATSWTAVSTGLTKSTGNVCRFVPSSKKFVVTGVNYGSQNIRNTIYISVYNTVSNSVTASTSYTNNGWNGSNPCVVGDYACFVNPRYNDGNYLVSVNTSSGEISATKLSSEVDGICVKLPSGFAVISDTSCYLFNASGTLTKTITTGATVNNSLNSNLTQIGSKFYVSGYSSKYFICTEDFESFEVYQSGNSACDILQPGSDLCFCEWLSGTANIYYNIKTLPVITADKVYAYIKAKEG